MQPNEQMDLMRWLSDQFGRMHYGMGQLQAGQLANRETVLAVRRELSERMDRWEQRGVHTRGWIRHFPWKIAAQLTISGGLLLAGHLTVPEIKGWLGIPVSPGTSGQK